MKLQPVSGVGWLKAGFLGFQSSGKTFTSIKMAIGLRKKLGLDGPIAMFDTEMGAEYVAPMVKKETGKDLLVVHSRAMSDAVEFLNSCKEQGVSVAIVDSISHIWKELCSSYLDQVNTQRAKRNRPKLQRLSFQDWGQLKGMFQVFTDTYLTIPLHVIICGRAAYDYDYREVDEKMELMKTGVRMRAESEFGYEPSLLIEMVREQEMDESGKAAIKVKRRAIVLKDRFNLIDGKVFYDPKAEDFMPHIDALKFGETPQIDLNKQTDFDVDDDGQTDGDRDKKRRQILCEEAQGILTNVCPGMSAKEKWIKAEAINDAFGTRSWTAVEALGVGELKSGVDDLFNALSRAAAKAEEIEKEKAKKGAKK